VPLLRVGAAATGVIGVGRGPLGLAAFALAVMLLAGRLVQLADQVPTLATIPTYTRVADWLRSAERARERGVLLAICHPDGRLEALEDSRAVYIPDVPYEAQVECGEKVVKAYEMRDLANQVEDDAVFPVRSVTEILIRCEQLTFGRPAA